MSSMPFCLGIPVVDELKSVTEETNVILRAKNREEAWHKIRALQNKMSVKDLICVYEIGVRPDSPIPVAMHFSEIAIRPNKAEDHVMCNLVWGWVQIVTGLKDYCYD